MKTFLHSSVAKIGRTACALLILLSPTCAFSQSTQEFQGFEGNSSELPYSSTGTSTIAIYTNTSTPSNSALGNRTYQRTGSNGWAVVNTSGQPELQQVVFRSLRYRGGATGNAFEFSLAALTTQPNGGLDRLDYVLVEASLNDGGTWNPIVRVTGGANRTNGQPAQSVWDYNATQIASATLNVLSSPTPVAEFIAPQDVSTAGFSKVRISITGIPIGSFADIVFRITAYNTDNNEIWALDDFSGISTRPLPVEFTSVSAVRQNSAVLLKWTTAQEKDNSHFEVERSANGSDFRIINKIYGRNTTLNASTYSFTDKQPLEGTNYYRLRQVDIDGAASHSQIVVVSGWSSGLLLSPNPVVDQLNVHFAGEAQQWSIINLTGQVLKKGTITSNMLLNVSDLRNGIYFFEVASSSKRTVQCFIKQD